MRQEKARQWWGRSEPETTGDRRFSTEMDPVLGKKSKSCEGLAGNSVCRSVPRWSLVLVLAAACVVHVGIALDVRAGDTPPAAGKWKILHVMSYHAPWKWTDDQFNGFKYALRDLDIEYQVFQMDTKRNSGEAWRVEAGRRARALIDDWHPDLVYTNDDYAQEYVSRYYVGADIPFVFSGVNAAPAAYGFTGSANITGILEQEHFVETVHLLKEIVPGVRRIAIIYDDGATWPGVISRMTEKAALMPDIEIVALEKILTFDQYKKRVTALQTEVDAIGLLGIFTFKDEHGENVPYDLVLKWTAENSRLPDFSFWKDRISYGTLCAVTVSGYEQGVAAGLVARQILVEGKSPSELAMKPTTKGEPAISLARARRLGLRIKSGILLASDVVDTFKWEAR